MLATNSSWTKSLRDGLPRLWHSDFLFSITKQWKASPKSSIVKSPQNNNQTGSTSPLPMKRIPPFHLVGKRFYDPNAPPYKAVFLITTDFIWRILLCMKNIYNSLRKPGKSVTSKIVPSVAIKTMFLTFWNIRIRIPKNLPVRMSGFFCLRKKRKDWKPQLWIFTILPSVFSIEMSCISFGMTSQFHVWS